MLDKREGYEFGETLLRRGRDEVAVALGVDGDGDDEEQGQVEYGLNSRDGQSGVEATTDQSSEIPAKSNGIEQ